MSITFNMRGIACLIAVAGLSGCVGGGDRYPDLNLRDFERVQGTFTSAASATETSQPAPLSASTLSEVQSALEIAGERHQQFLFEARRARPIVNSASGKGIEDNIWPIAQIEIAALESRNGEIASLLADLDALYANASLDFTQREQIDAARDQITDLYAAERQVIAEFTNTLAGSSQP